ncbi:hypothetical protein [Clostridium thermarum]|uniref:hypothetical protein n=1 Tax=Clostridium thermarum TaxID=1716543 RepID=UPI0011208188|nr:hypothetical protein [Clostridium thermarum]
MEFGKLKLPKKSNDFLIWALVALIVLGFGKSSDTLGFNFFSLPDKSESRRKGHDKGKNNLVPVGKGPGFPAVIPGPLSGFLGGNGLFLLAIIALLFLCKDDKKKGHDNKREVSYCEEN